ncbi:MAG TPA: hypothetical protein VJZ91_10460 [Blastocatellia bacterium]|nr:hypothetical protein [Blastocatellia bacterium]
MTYRGDHRGRAKAAARLKRLPPGVAALWLMGFVLLAAPAVRAQDDLPPLPVDPTPLADLMTAQEKALLAGANNPKKAIEAYLRIADGRIDAALVAVKSNDAARAERELDAFQKAMAECVKATEALAEGKRAVAKKIEQSLYKELRTLESVERLFPVERVQFAEAAIKRAKRFRVQMLNIAIASGEVLKDPEADKPPKSNDQAERRDGLSPLRPPLELPDESLMRPALWRESPPMREGASDASLRRWVRQIPGDYLTEEEDDHVREAQAPDDRIKVFMRIADRRLAALKPPPPAPTDPKEQKKAEEKAAEEKKEWGELPKLDRATLLRHYARAIEECIAKLEDAYERNPKSKSLAKALEMLRDGTDRHLQTLRALLTEVKDERETDALRRAIEQAETANEGARKGVKAKTT